MPRACEPLTVVSAEGIIEAMALHDYDLADFLEQLRKIGRLGSVRDLMKLVPGIGAHVDGMDFDEDELARVEAIIRSMTPEERSRPGIIDPGRRDRIARGSGTSPADVDDLLGQFFAMGNFLDRMTRVSWRGDLPRPSAS